MANHEVENLLGLSNQAELSNSDKRNKIKTKIKQNNQQQNSVP